MNKDRNAPADTTPAPRPFFNPPCIPYYQPGGMRDLNLFLHRTAGKAGHTFTERGRE